MSAFENTTTAKDLAIVQARHVAAQMREIADWMQQQGEPAEDVQKVREKAEQTLINAGDVDAPINMQGKCARCAGTGVVNRFKHVNGGRCYECNGVGVR